MIVVVEPGLRTTVQDAGRPGLAHLGIGASGAADWISAALANALVGNGGVAAARSAAVLESTFRGPALRFDVDALVAVTGAVASVTVEGSPVPRDGAVAVPGDGAVAVPGDGAVAVPGDGAVAVPRGVAVAVPRGVAFPVRAGQLLRIGPATEGLRSYLAVHGGFDVPAVLGSRSTDTLSGLGPAPLVRGDRLGVCASPTPLLWSTIATEQLWNVSATEQLWNASATEQSTRESVGTGAAGSASVEFLTGVLAAGRRPLRLIEGPRFGWLTRQARQALFGSEFAVSTAADRVGVRLVGTALACARSEAPDSAAPTAETEGMVTGAVQLPPDGEPIVLLADHATTGGYPVPAVVASVDVPLVAQARPGTVLQFVAVSADAARSARIALVNDLDGLAARVRQR